MCVHVVKMHCSVYEYVDQPVLAVEFPIKIFILYKTVIYISTIDSNNLLFLYLCSWSPKKEITVSKVQSFLTTFEVMTALFLGRAVI